jgi:hypothetical protein
VLIRVSPIAISLSPYDLSVPKLFPPLIPPCSRSVHLPNPETPHSNSMSTLERAEMDTKPDRTGFKSLSPSSSPSKHPNTLPTLYKPRPTLSYRSRRQRTSSGTSFLPPSPEVTALTNRETPSTPSRLCKYPPLTPSASVSSFGTTPFTLHTPRTPPKSPPRSVLPLS